MHHHRENPVCFMAGGFGTRLHPLTQDCPKPLLKVGKKPILEIILERCISEGFHRFFISTHYMHELIKNYFGDGSRWGVSIQYLYEQFPLGTGGALGLLPHEEINLPLFLINADLITNINLRNLLAFHLQHPAIATMCVREYEMKIPYGVIQNRGHLVQSIVEKPTYRFCINAGIYLLAPELIKNVSKNVPIDITTVLELQIAMGKDVNMFPMHEDWLDIGHLEDFQLAQYEYAFYTG